MLLMLMLAELAIQPQEKADVHRTTAILARCVQAQIGELDDGLSEARTIARAAATSCPKEREALRLSWKRAIDDLAGKAAETDGEMASEEARQAQLDRTMRQFDASLLENGTRWVLQKREMAKEAAPPQ
ncbi:MAG: hypothetical protein EOP61_42940 [Sphingomonadales bacterium]|nr:MAG: hypothetical protein EOP61_42940 [Sphingomonadales bacterium]